MSNRTASYQLLTALIFTCGFQDAGLGTACFLLLLLLLNPNLTESPNEHLAIILTPENVSTLGREAIDFKFVVRNDLQGHFQGQKGQKWLIHWPVNGQWKTSEWPVNDQWMASEQLFTTFSLKGQKQPFTSFSFDPSLKKASHYKRSPAGFLGPDLVYTKSTGLCLVLRVNYYLCNLGFPHIYFPNPQGP